MQGKQHAVLSGTLHLFGQELNQCAFAHYGGINDLACLQWCGLAKVCFGAVCGHEFDGKLCRRLRRDGFLVGAKIVPTHRRHVGLGFLGPGTHGVGVGSGVGLDRVGGAAVRVALTEDGVHRAAFDLVVAGFDRLLFVG